MPSHGKHRRQDVARNSEREGQQDEGQASARPNANMEQQRNGSNLTMSNIIGSHPVQPSPAPSVYSEGGRSHQEARYLESYALKCSRWAKRLEAKHSFGRGGAAGAAGAAAVATGGAARAASDAASAAAAAAAAADKAAGAAPGAARAAAAAAAGTAATAATDAAAAAVAAATAAAASAGASGTNESSSAGIFASSGFETQHFPDLPFQRSRVPSGTPQHQREFRQSRQASRRTPMGSQNLNPGALGTTNPYYSNSAAQSAASLASRDASLCPECPVCSSLSSIMSASMMAPASLNVDDQDTSETAQAANANTHAPGTTHGTSTAKTQTNNSLMNTSNVPERVRVSQNRVLKKMGVLPPVPLPPLPKGGDLGGIGPESSFGSVESGAPGALHTQLQIPSVSEHGPDVAFNDRASPVAASVRDEQTPKADDHSENKGDNAPIDSSKADVVLLEVSGMTCGACVGNVKALLEHHPDVKTASVNLHTGTALVHVRVPEDVGKSKLPTVIEKIGEDLATTVTDLGFDTKLRDVDAPIEETTAKELAKRKDRLQRLQWATYTVILAWVLTAVALAGHMLHQWKGLKDGPAILRWISSAPFQAAMSIFILFGPARGILFDGAKAVYHRRPDMNVLVALGAISGLVVSFVAYGKPSLGWTPFFAEPAMLLSVVLLGRSLEERAKLQASSDMAALYKLLPTTARLVVAGSDNTKEVPAAAVATGDMIMVLPGDRVPVDGVVISGRTTVNEAAVTGEPMPVVKVTGATVTAGTSNVDGVIKVQSEKAGGDTTIAGIVKSVEDAQARTAPVQKMADAVAGKFAMFVILVSLLTIAFWALAGPWAFPEAVEKASRVAFSRNHHSGGDGGHDEGAMDAAAMGVMGGINSTMNGTGLDAVAMQGVNGTAMVPTAAMADAGMNGGGGEATPAGMQGGRITMQWVLLAVQLGCSVLVVACPCALGLATPTAVLVGSSVAAKRGLLVRGGDILESMTRITHVVFDKTGTLTAGKPSVADVRFVGGAGGASSKRISGGSAATGGGGGGAGDAAASRTSPLRWSDNGTPGATNEDTMLALAAAVEEASMHPLAKAVVAERVTRNLPQRLLEDGSLLQEPGLGISGVVEGHEVAVGNEAWMNEATGGRVPHATLQALRPGATRIFVAVDGEFCGYLDLVDALRPTVKATLNSLHDRGLLTLMLTGDTQATAESVGALCGLQPEDIFAGVRPEGKLEKIESLQKEGFKVAMVGDGINDTSALAASDVGIAMSGGVQAAGDVAKVVLLRDDPSQVADAFRIAQVTLRKIRQNLVWAFGYNVVAIPIAAGILLPPFEIMLSPFISAALMAGSSLAVMGNSLLLRREAGKKSIVPESASAELSQSENSSSSDGFWKPKSATDMYSPRQRRRGKKPPGKNVSKKLHVIASPSDSPRGSEGGYFTGYRGDNSARSDSISRGTQCDVRVNSEYYYYGLPRDGKRVSGGRGDVQVVPVVEGVGGGANEAVALLPYRPAQRGGGKRRSSGGAGGGGGGGAAAAAATAALPRPAAPRAAAPMRQGLQRAGSGQRSSRLPPGDIRTMLVGQEQTGRRMH